MRILCVDDDANFAKQAREWLHPRIAALEWCYVSTLSACMQVLQDARAEGVPFDVLLLDLLLPGETLELTTILSVYSENPELTIVGLAQGNDDPHPVVQIAPKVFIANKGQEPAAILERLQTLVGIDG